MKAKYIIASIGVLGYVAYLKLSNYLKQSSIETANYLRAASGNTFFLIVDIVEKPTLKIPLLKWSIFSINLIVNNEVIATSLPILEQTNNFTQEFKPVETANFDSITTAEKTVVEITYKTVAGLKITHQYEVNSIVEPIVEAEPESGNSGSGGSSSEAEQPVATIINQQPTTTIINQQTQNNQCDYATFKDL